MKTKKGQVVIEGIAGMGTLIGLFFFVLLVYFYLGSHLWIHHHLYESLFCAAKEYSIDFCKNKSLNQTKKLVFLGEFRNFKLVKKGRTWQGSLDWDLDFVKPFHFERRLTIPTDLLKKEVQIQRRITIPISLLKIGGQFFEK